MPPTRPGNLGVLHAGTFTRLLRVCRDPDEAFRHVQRGDENARRLELAAGVEPREDTWEFLNERAATC